MKTLLKKITQIILRENPNNLLDLCIVGLGNPGDKHKKTRHNAGYDFVELLANDLNVELKDTKKLDALYGELSIGDSTIALVKPIKMYCPLISIDAVDTLAPTVDIPIGMVQLPA